MPIYRLPAEPIFPPAGEAEADPNGLLAVGGDLSPERLLAAYRAGIFPWYSDDQPILWWSPDPRLVLFPKDLVVGSRLARTIRSRKFLVRADTAFERVMRRCGEKPRRGQRGTWITEDMVRAYVALHQRGLAHSIEAWSPSGEALLGGLYGVAVGAVFCGESMFADATDASKVAFVTLVRQLEAWGFDFVDCQVRTEHLVSLGAVEVPRSEYLARLAAAIGKPGRPGAWTLDLKLEAAPGAARK